MNGGMYPGWKPPGAGSSGREIEAERTPLKRAWRAWSAGLALALGLGLSGWSVQASDPAGARADRVAVDAEAAERGRAALTGRSFLAPAWSLEAYTKARSRLGSDAPDPATDPEGYAAAFNAHYGLHPAPYPNDGLPMGLRRAVDKKGTVGLQVDCMVCHGGSIGGTSYVGLGNTQLDLEALLQELTVVDGKIPPPSLFTLNSSRGTNNAGQIDVVLLQMRNADLSFRLLPYLTGANLPELDTPPWWNLNKKQTKYYDGRTDARATRSNMQFMLGELSRDEFAALEPTFEDIEQYQRSLTPPKYPYPIDPERADLGRAVFEANCARCHGTYGDDWTYPNKVIAIDVIGTDRARLDGLSDRFVAHYNATWFGEKHPVVAPRTGYQAPPLDGIWASAPYLHNGSVPTLYHLLDSASRPARFKRPPSTAFEHYDPKRVGWLAEEVPGPVDPKLSKAERKQIFDSSRWGLGNGGHTFGDKLSEEDRWALIEYLKTL